MGCEKQLTVNRESFRNHTIAKIAGPLKGKENTCKADVRKCLEDGLAMRLPLRTKEIYKDSLATDNRSNIGSEFTFEIDLPGKRDHSTIYCLNLIKLYRRKPELANLVMENSSEGIHSETLYSVRLFMDFGFQGKLRKSQLYFKLPPDRSSYLRMINAKKKERFLPESGTIFLRRKDINLVTGKPFRIKTCCLSQMLINSLREDIKYLLDLGVNGWGSQTVLCPLFGFCEGDTRNRWRDGQVCPDVDKELWRLGPDGSGVFWRWTVCPDVDKELWRLGPDGSRPGGKRRKSREKRTRESGRENGRKEEERRKRERGDGKRVGGESEARLEWRKRAESGNWSEKTMNAGGVEYGL
ncbi:uncharacterized protein TNCV_4358421 [Trichonephila clavipes]|nr:uncharacterized protein TNCV_4358421 [Trichonephila clavipes]